MSKEEIEKAKKRLNKKLKNERELERTSSYSEIVDEIIKDNKSIETLLQYIDQLEQENSKKDKIIDEMVECIYNYDICDYEITDYTYRKCEYIADDEEKHCRECIKQYFERKVEESK